MTQDLHIVPLHVLDTDVDLHVTGHDAAGTAAAIAQRWHLALREGEGSLTATVVEAALLPPDRDEAAPWTREETVVHHSDLPRLLQLLTQSVTYAVIGARSGELLMLHAAALAHPVTGAAAGFVAPGNTGKTTLCRTLGPELSYLTDETLGIRRDGTIAAYLKPLSTRRTDWLGVKDEQAPGALRLQAPPAPPWIAGLVILERDPEHAGEPLVEELDTLDAVIALTPESSAFMKTERPLQWLADVLERTGGARRATYGEVAQLRPLAHEICGRPSPW
ncbi:MAG: hypothetical protein Q4P07_02525 [Ornithinimicrobium sp.]|uniref:hypothetical protein n=1 Tax=Ornithinimicrobium sp. TaxID=1977084 RepID=UPI0026DF4793|nr:hypothetical protein [Ornithinimicrobium sp.]MDO5739003.1 hypothetical protein [Ornithinimicrobium sp.]